MLYYAISSSYDYYQTTLPILLSTLPIDDINCRFIIAICNTPFDKNEDREAIKVQNLNIAGYSNVMAYYVNWNAFDYSSLILSNILIHENDSCFLLHDTCKPGPNFHNIISSFDNTKFDLVDVYNGYCNFGLYKGSFLKQNEQFLNGCKNISKERAIDLEFELFRICKNKSRFPSRQNDGDYVRLGEQDVYGTGHLRLVEHYTNIDLFKYKANYCRKSVYFIGV